MKTLVYLLFLAISFIISEKTCLGFAFFDKIKVATTPLGNKEKYCVYTDPTTKQVWEIYPGSSFKTRTCVTCKCTDKGLECYGNGVIAPPPGCKVVVDACEQVLVTSTYPTRPCQP